MTTGPLPTIVRTKLDLRLVISADQSVLIPAVFDYTASDPFSVHATFHTGDGHVAWVFGRELLAQGLAENVGEGDVAIWPSNRNGHRVVCIALSSPSGHALMEADRGEIEDFLARSYSVVERGSEDHLMDIDNLIDRILSEGGPASV